MERDCEICPDTGFGKHQMATGLTTSDPSCLFKAPCGFLTRDVAQLAQILSSQHPIVCIS